MICHKNYYIFLFFHSKFCLWISNVFLTLILKMDDDILWKFRYDALRSKIYTSISCTCEYVSYVYMWISFSSVHLYNIIKRSFLLKRIMWLVSNMLLTPFKLHQCNHFFKCSCTIMPRSLGTYEAGKILDLDVYGNKEPKKMILFFFSPSTDEI